MNLWTPADIVQIREGYRDTLDTYCNNTVTLKIASGSVDLFNEDRDDVTYTDYTFDAIVTFAKSDSQNDPSLGGAIDVTKAEVVVSMDKLLELGLLDANYNPKVSEATDLLVINGLTYRLSEVAPQGHFIGSKQVKCHFKCQIEKRFYP